MPAWYDIYSLDELDEREDQAGLEDSAEMILDLVKEERTSGIPLDRIFIGGFSQGGCACLFTTLTHPYVRLAGVIALSAYLPARTFLQSLPLRARTVPIFMGHGTADMLVQYQWHQHSAEYLKKLDGPKMKIGTYEGIGHSTCRKEMEDVAEFIQEQLANAKGTKDEL